MTIGVIIGRRQQEQRHLPGLGRTGKRFIEAVLTDGPGNESSFRQPGRRRKRDAAPRAFRPPSAHVKRPGSIECEWPIAVLWCSCSISSRQQGYRPLHPVILVKKDRGGL